MTMATLKDVAERAGVSASTVSYVLNGKKKVRPETLERINEAIRTLNYQPNLLASSLKTNQSKTIGLVVSDLKSIFFVDILASIEEELGKQGYCMIVCNAENNQEKEKKCLEQLSSRNIDGLILIGIGGSVFYDLWEKRVPMVCIDRVSDERLLTVLSDNEMGGYLGTRHLISRGYQRIVFFGSQNMKFVEQRYRGYQRAMEEVGLAPRLREQKSLDWEEACQMAQDMIRENMDFDAIFGCTDYIAIGALKGVIRGGRSVPGQVGVLGYDDIAPAKYTIPELSTVAQPRREMGIMAVQCLYRLLKNEEIREKQILLQPWIVERESC